jgi:hypothetical protein
MAIDWNKYYKGGFDDRRRKAHGQMTSKELFQKAHERLEAQENQQDFLKKAMPILKQELIKAMTSKTPIILKANIQNATETLGGLTKSEEDDGFYASKPSQSQNIGSFQEVMETIPAGTALTFKHLNKSLDQFIFLGDNGEEYAIYTKDRILFQNQPIDNPGLYGLLFNSSLADVLSGGEE